MILEKLTKTDPILLDLRLDLEDEGLIVIFTGEEVYLSNVGGLLSILKLLGSSEGVTIVYEFKILNLVFVSAVDLHYSFKLFIRHGEAKVGQSLSELLRRDLEVFVAIPILEETLGVKSVSLEPFSEGSDHSLNKSSLVRTGISATIEGLGPCIFEGELNLLFKSFLVEDLIN